jgi:hypothetical protein
MMMTVFSPAEPQARVLAQSAAQRGKQDHGNERLESQTGSLP